MPRRSHSVAVNKHWHERFSDSCPDLPCYHCGRAKILVRVRQSGDAIMPDGRCVAYGTPGSEPQCVVTTPCETCAETDQTIEGSSWEDVGNGESYTILSGEESDVVQRLLDDGYDAMSEG